MINNIIEKGKPIKCALTKIENEFESSGYQQHYNYFNILKNYVYIPEKKVIA